MCGAKKLTTLAEINQTSSRFFFFFSLHQLWRWFCWVSWPRPNPSPSSHVNSQSGAPSLYLGVYSRAFVLWGSPAFICQWMLRDTRWQGAEALKHFRSKCPLFPFPLFFFSFLSYYPLLFGSTVFAHLALPQTSACRRARMWCTHGLFHSIFITSEDITLT